MKPTRRSHVRVFATFRDFASFFHLRRDDRNRRQLYTYSFDEPISPYDAYHHIQGILSRRIFFEPEDVWGLRCYRAKVPDGCRPRPVVALYPHFMTDDGFWWVPFLDVDGAWCAEMVYPLAPYYNREWDLLISRLGPLPKSAS